MTRYAFVRDSAGKLVPVGREDSDGPSAEVMLDQFRAEKARTAETLQRAGSTARSITKGLRRSASQQRIQAALSNPPPEPERKPGQ